MGRQRNTITDVRSIVEFVNTDYDGELSFTCHGVGQNKYQIIDSDTGETFGQTCVGATEFIKTLRAFHDGLRRGGD